MPNTDLNFLMTRGVLSTLVLVKLNPHNTFIRQFLLTLSVLENENSETTKS